MMKPSAASARLLSHRGRAVVFESIEDLHARIDDPRLDVDESSVLVLQGLRAQAAIRACQKSATCRCRESSWSGREGHGAYLRCADEWHGLRNGRAARLARSRSRRAACRSPKRRRNPARWPGRRLELLVPAAELAARLASQSAGEPPRAKYTRGYYRLYIEHVAQADRGCDLDFLVGGSGSVVERESH